MKKLLNKLKALVAIVSVFAIVAVSILSTFTGINITAFASEKTTSVFTGVEKEISLQDAAAKNSKDNPYIIENAGQLYALMSGVATNNGETINTAGKYFKVADGIDEFYMNGGATVASLKNADEVKAHFESKGSAYTLMSGTITNPFQGTFDGNGAIVYGLYYNAYKWNGGAGLFPYVAGTVTIKNIAVKNSYLVEGNSGAIVGYARVSATAAAKEFKNVQLKIESCESANNYIESKHTDGGAGGLVGNMGFSGDAGGVMPVAVDNCLVYGNSLVSTSGLPCSAIGGNFNAPSNSFKNSVLLDNMPFVKNGYHTYKTSAWENCYTNQVVNGVTDQNYTGVINTVTGDSLIGAGAKETMGSLDQSVWFFSEGAIPQLRVFHKIKGESIGVDGHQKEKDTCCGNAAVLSDGVIAHTYVGDKCTVCDYKFPCTSGHTFTFHEEVPATTEKEGNIAYNSCSGCMKNYAEDAAIDAPVSAAIANVVIPQLLPYDNWDGTYDSYFWMNNTGDGSQGNPFIIGSAEQLMALVAGKLEYNENQPTSKKFDLSKYTIKNDLLDTTNLYFKVKDGLGKFYINGGTTVAELADANAVKNYFESNGGSCYTIKGNIRSPFQGNFNGNGAVVYGLYYNAYAWNGGAGLFPYVAGDVTIKNVAVRNSYLVEGSAGAIVGYSRVSATAKEFTNIQLTVYGCESSNNYIESKHTDGGAGGLVGNMGTSGDAGGCMPLAVNNCFVKDNILVSSHGLGCSAVGGSFSSQKNSISNSVFLGHTPFIYGSYWTLINTVYTNCYTDKNLENGNSAYSETYYGTRLVKISEDTVGEVALSVMGELDKTVWFFSENAVPKLRAFHKLSGTPVDADVHTNEKDVCCDANVIGSDNVAHKYVGSSCEICGYTFQCAVSGHNYTTYQGYEATYENDGLISHKACSVCDRNYPIDASEKASATEAIENVVIPRLIHFDAGKPWTGRIAEVFRSGEGTKENPYKIDAPEYFALMLYMDATDLYFELTADIIINDTSAENWKDSARRWFTSQDVKAFAGTLEGNGHTVYGLFYDDVLANVSAGLIPVKGSGNVNNVVVADSYINGSDNAVVGAIIGSIANNASKPIVMQGNTVTNTVVIDGKAIAGGIVGKGGNSILRMSNCNSQVVIKSSGTSGGLVGVTTDGTSVKYSVSVGNAPVGNTDAKNIVNVYTNVNTKTNGVITLSDEQMTGEATKENMAELDFDKFWKTTDSYPVINGTVVAVDGIKGEIWSGEIAKNYAGGSGTIDDPYLVATAEQLALVVTENSENKHYKLVADIYLNDVNSPFWKDKVGCNEWFLSRSYDGKRASRWGIMKNGSFDGDGYVVYGLYYNTLKYTDNGNYDYGGLFPAITEGTHIKNVGVSDVHIDGAPDKTKGWGGLVGIVIDWNKQEVIDKFGAGSNMENLFNMDAEASKAYTGTDEFQAKMPEISNCFVDHTAYIAGYNVGGIIGCLNAPVRVKNCIFTGTLQGVDKARAGGIAGSDLSYGSYYIDCVSFPQTCDLPLSGASNNEWRTAEQWHVTTATDVYYFSMYRAISTPIKIANPKQRIGEEAMKSMPNLDWTGNEEDGTEDIWRTVENGTPMLTIFDKHRDDADKFSDKSFTAPYVTVSLVTGTSDVQLEPITGRMYSQMELPTPVREGYVFTGWYPHSNLSIEYPYDYFPPKSMSLYAGWAIAGIMTNFENYPDTIWDYDDTRWILNKPGAKGGYKSAYVRKGNKSMHLLDTSSEPADVLLNYTDMLKVGKTYTLSLWVTTDKVNNPDTQLSLVHNAAPEYLDTGIAMEDMMVVKGLTVGEWTQYKYTFTAQTKWVSIRATGNSSLYFDDIMMIATEDEVSGGNMVQLNSGSVGDKLSPSTADSSISVAVLISLIMACATIAVISRKNLVEIIED